METQTPSQTKEVPAIPTTTMRVTIIVGVPNPQDGDSRRRLRIYEGDGEIPPVESLFEQETEGMSADEEARWAADAMNAICMQGFRCAGNGIRLRDGSFYYHFRFERQQAKRPQA